MGDRVHDRGERAGAAGFAAALDAEHVGFRRHRVIDDGDFGRIARARERIVHERAGQELPVAIVDRHLHQRLADALDHATMQLTLDDTGVTETYFTTSITPVSGSSSTSHTWHP